MTSVQEDTIITKKNSIGRIIPNDIVYVFYSSDTYLEIQDFEEGLETYRTLAQGEPLKILVEIGPFTTVTPEARKFAQENNPEPLAEAVIIHSLAQRVLAKFYVLFHHSPHPLRIFDNKEQGIKWLNSK